MSTSVVRCPHCGTKNRVPAVSKGRPACGSCHQAVPWLVDATTDNFADVASAPVLVLVDLWAPWCGPCRTIGPLIEQAATDLAGQLKVVKVNVDQSPEVSAQYGVQGIPTMLLLRDGKEVSRKVGAIPAPDLKSWIATELTDQG